MTRNLAISSKQPSTGRDLAFMNEKNIFKILTCAFKLELKYPHSIDENDDNDDDNVFDDDVIKMV